MAENTNNSEKVENTFFRDPKGFKRMGHLISFLTVTTAMVVTFSGLFLIFTGQPDTGGMLVSIGLGQGIAGGGMEAWSDHKDSGRENTK